METVSRASEPRSLAQRGTEYGMLAGREAAGRRGPIGPDAGRGREVLIVDDEPGIRSALLAHFSREGWRVTVAAGVREAEMRIGQTDYALVVTDVRMADGTGVELLRQLRQASSQAPVILLTGFGTVAEAVEAMQLGASDYLMKPVAWKELRARLQRLEQEQGPEDGARDGAAGERAGGSGGTGVAASGLIGRSSALLQAVARARAAGTTDAHVLVEGESGTGKRPLARYVHAASARAAGLLVTIDCAGARDGGALLQLATAVRGACGAAGLDAEIVRALAEAFGRCEMEGGTLLLEHVEALSGEGQRALAACFERARADAVRMLATAGSGIGALVEQGRFRADLYYRLSGIALVMPALREREGDIALLAEYFSRQWAGGAGMDVPVLERGFTERLAQWDWPGNVRQLRECVDEILSGWARGEAGARLDAACLDLWQAGAGFAGGSRAKESHCGVLRADAGAALEGESGNAAALYETQGSQHAGQTGAEHRAAVGLPIRQLERLHVEKTLAMTKGNRTQAAELLGISLRTMRNRIREYGLPPRRYA